MPDASPTEPVLEVEVPAEPAPRPSEPPWTVTAAWVAGLVAGAVPLLACAPAAVIVCLLCAGLACGNEFVIFPLIALAVLIPMAAFALAAGLVLVSASLGLRRRSGRARQVLTCVAAINALLGLAGAYLSACALYARLVGAASEPVGGVRGLLLGGQGWTTACWAVWALACCVCYACARARATEEYCLAGASEDGPRPSLLRL